MKKEAERRRLRSVFLLFYMKKAGKVQKTSIYILLHLLYNKIKCEKLLSGGRSSEGE